MTDYSRKLDFGDEEKPPTPLSAQALFKISDAKNAKERAAAAEKERKDQAKADREAPKIFNKELERINAILVQIAKRGDVHMIGDEARQVFECDVRNPIMNRVYDMLVEHYKKMNFVIRHQASPAADDDDNSKESWHLLSFTLDWSSEAINTELRERQKAIKRQQQKQKQFDEERATETAFESIADMFDEPIEDGLMEGDAEKGF